MNKLKVNEIFMRLIQGAEKSIFEPLLGHETVKSTDEFTYADHSLKVRATKRMSQLVLREVKENFVEDAKFLAFLESLQ